MLDCRDSMIMEAFSSRIRAKMHSARIWAFGSRTKGTHTEESDLDVCVVVEDMTPDRRSYISECAWEVGFEHDRVICTIAFSKSMFENGPASASPLVHGIIEEGVPT
ncbi:MAG: nucleotidyltransferase domain-containing protein [Candidatus Sumerlaeota bacterium]|nr:nucleotidyltransferase domain-containing protein [Candidatus Sumerlaeota bacterium]